MNTVSTTSWPVCPPAHTVEPCDCNTTSGHFVCGKSISYPLDLKYIFQESSRHLKQENPKLKNTNIIYHKFIFQNSILDHLESNFLDTFAFREVQIDHNDYLQTIGINSFISTYNTTDRVLFESNPSIGLKTTEVINFFNVLSQFRNASHIQVIDCGLTFIPDNAFRPLNGVQTRLQRVSFAKNRITTVGDFSFSNLPNIEFLSFHKNLIHNFSKLSLVFSNSSDHLLLDVSKNLLTYSSFDSEALLSIRRPFDLQLSDNLITHLNETIFKPLFKNSIFIKLWRNPINCSDCRMKWTSNEKLCGLSNNTISYSQRIEFQCKLFKDNFRRCQNDTYAGAEELLENTLPCPLISGSTIVQKCNTFIILSSILTLSLFHFNLKIGLL